MGSTDAWTNWRLRLAELRRALDAHFAAAEALSAEASAATIEDAARSPERSDDPEDRGHDRAGDDSAGANTREAPRVDMSPEVQRALAHLADHYDRPMSVAELARVAGCSRDRLARLVRRETGLSVHAHLMQLRLARAAREVRAGDKIEAVMLGVGYRGKRNFYRQFKARFGSTPGRWRHPDEEGQR